MEQRLFIAIVSCQPNSHRRKMCRETWLSLLNNPNVEYKFFVGGPEIEIKESDVVHLCCDDSHSLLLDKHYYIYKYCLEHYDFDKFLCVDDDTYVRVDEMYKVAQTEDMCMANRKDSFQNRTVYGGGGRYIPKNYLIDYTNWLAYNRCHLHGLPDDVVMGNVFDQMGIPLLNNHVNMIWHKGSLEWLKPWLTYCCDPADKMYTAHNIVTNTADAYMYAITCWWKDVLGFRKNGTFLKYGSIAGKWKLMRDDLVLEWADGNVYVLSNVADDLYAAKNVLLQSHNDYPTLSSITKT